MGRPTRRTFTAQQKLEIVLQLARGDKQLTALAREQGVDHTTIYRWRYQMQAGALDALEGKRRIGPKRSAGSAGGLTRVQAERELRRRIQTETSSSPVPSVAPSAMPAPRTEARGGSEYCLARIGQEAGIVP